MSGEKVYRAIGLMSGTSLDGEIDVALIETDGQGFVKPLDFKPFPYDISARDKVRACFGKREPDAGVAEAEKLVTDLHIAAVKASGFEAEIIGFHGQTITHAPDEKFTWQIGDGARLAAETGMDVICDFRSNDVALGGQGAPLIPLYHAAMMAKMDKPVGILNLGGVANITFVGNAGEILAFDTGPANALMDDFMLRHMGAAFDRDGRLARQGQVDEAMVAAFLRDVHFAKSGPKSLDRNQWDLKMVDHLNAADGMATLAEMSAAAVNAGIASLPARPGAIYVCGGGRKNAYVMERLGVITGLPVLPIEQAGWNGDATEAEGFAYLAVRSLLKLPISLPSTTGVPEPAAGGIYHRKS